MHRGSQQPDRDDLRLNEAMAARDQRDGRRRRSRRGLDEHLAAPQPRLSGRRRKCAGDERRRGAKRRRGPSRRRRADPDLRPARRPRTLTAAFASRRRVRQRGGERGAAAKREKFEAGVCARTAPGRRRPRNISVLREGRPQREADRQRETDAEREPTLAVEKKPDPDVRHPHALAFARGLADRASARGNGKRSGHNKRALGRTPAEPEPLPSLTGRRGATKGSREKRVRCDFFGVTRTRGGSAGIRGKPGAEPNQSKSGGFPRSRRGDSTMRI